MIEPDPMPRPQVLRIGPGGLPADQLRPVGHGAPSQVPPVAPEILGLPLALQHLAGHNAPRDERRWGLPAAGAHYAASASGSARRVVVRVVVGLIVATVVAVGLWANSNSPFTDTGAGAAAPNIAVGDCLSSTDQQIVGQVDCTSGSADFAVVGISAESSDASDCSASPSDVVVVAAGPMVLCLDYVAAVGQCLFAKDQSAEVGKVACSNIDPRVLRVLAVLRNSINPAACPAATRQSLVHRFNSQVLCLGAN